MTTQPPRGRPPLPEKERASTWLQVRLSPMRKRAYERAAKGPVSKWAVKVLDKAARAKGIDPVKTGP